MKNKLKDLNDHLFLTIEKLNDETLRGDGLKDEIKRALSIARVGEIIVRNADVVLKAHALACENGQFVEVPENLLELK